METVSESMNLLDELRSEFLFESDAEFGQKATDSTAPKIKTSLKRSKRTLLGSAVGAGIGTRLAGPPGGMAGAVVGGVIGANLDADSVV